MRVFTDVRDSLTPTVCLCVFVCVCVLIMCVLLQQPGSSGLLLTGWRCISTSFICSLLFCVTRAHLVISVQQVFWSPSLDLSPFSPTPTPTTTATLSHKCINYGDKAFGACLHSSVFVRTWAPQPECKHPPFSFIFYYSHSFTQSSLSLSGPTPWP